MNGSTKMKKLRRNIVLYFKNILIGIDQLVNSIFFGDPDETVSSRAYRLNETSITWSIVMTAIDLLFFWDTFTTDNGKVIRHCKFSYLMNLKRKQGLISNSHAKDHIDLVKEIKKSPYYKGQ